MSKKVVNKPNRTIPAATETVVEVKAYVDENGYRYETYVSKEVPVVKFNGIAKKLTQHLLGFATKNNLGKTTTFNNQKYTLDFLSISQKSCSIYYCTKRSVIRISDHWSYCYDRPRSRKFNCGNISGHFWMLSKPTEPIDFKRWSGFKRTMLAGQCGKSVLNKSCAHWQN